MLRFVLMRLCWVLITVWAVATISFFLIRAAPGDPFMAEIRNLRPEVREARRREYGLDRPLMEQYLRWIWGILSRGDLGPSMKYRGKTVAGIIGQTLPTSLALGSLAMVFALTFGLLFGVLAALRQNRFLDYFLMALSVLGISLPSFVVAMALIFLFVFLLNIFPLAGWNEYRQAVLPALALSLPFIARISRLARVGMLEVLGEDFILTAHAKGLRSHQVVIRHALRGAVLPVVSFLGPAFAMILTGSLVIEKIFFIPGLGKIFIQAAINRDYYVVLGTVVVFSSLLALFNFLVDLSYAFLDPRVRLDR
jgi:oligopeptide transport system permease protein